MNFQTIVDRMAIADLLHILARAVDRNDAEQVLACFDPAAKLSLGYFDGGVDSYIARFRALAEMSPALVSVTQHRISNISIGLVGHDAWVESYYDVCRRFVRPDGEQWDELAAVRALDRMVRRDERWVIRERKLIWDWGCNWPASAPPWMNDKNYITGSRAADDPSNAFWADHFKAERNDKK